MAALNSVILVSAVGFSQACSGTTVVAEDGSQQCYPRTKVSTQAFQADTLGDQYISAKNCFQQYCKSDTIRNLLVDSCKTRGFKHCDSLSYHDTYTQDISTQQYTYSFVGHMDYDEGHAKVTPSWVVAGVYPYDNGGKLADTENIHHGISKASTASWTSSQDFSFEEDIDISVTVGIPETVGAKTDITDKFHIGLSTSQSHTESIDQSYDVTDSVKVAPHSCDTVCVNENDEDTVVPYTLRGAFKPSGILSNNAGYMCCYLREGGADSCNWGGHGDSGGAGWLASGSPGAAAAWGTAQGHNQCPHITENGDDAHIDLPGSWTGGMKISHNVVKIEHPSGKCATCPDPSAAKWTAPALTALVV